MPNYIPSDAEKGLLEYRRPGSNWETLVLEGDFANEWSLVPATMGDYTPLPNHKREPDGTLVLTPCPDGRGISETVANKTKGTSTIDHRKYRAPNGDSVIISRITGKLAGSLMTRSVKRLGFDGTSPACVTYDPVFEGGETMDVRITPVWELALRNTLTVLLPGEPRFSWTNYPWQLRTAVVVGQNEAGGSLAPGCWPAYDKQTPSNSAFQLTLAKVGCVADDEPLLNQRQDNEFWNWKPNLAESKKTDAVEMDVPCTRNGSNVTAKLIMRTTIARHRDGDVASLPFLRP